MEEASPAASPRRAAAHATLTPLDALAFLDPARVISAEAPVAADPTPPSAPSAAKPTESLLLYGSSDDLSLICAEKTANMDVDALLAAADRARTECSLRQDVHCVAPVTSQPTCKTVPADPALSYYHRPAHNISAASSADSLCGSEASFSGAHTPTPPDRRSPAHGQNCASPSPLAGSAARSQRRRNSGSRRSSRSHSLPPLYEAHDEDVPSAAISAPISPDLNKATTSARPVTAGRASLAGGRHDSFRRRVKSDPPQPVPLSVVPSQILRPPASPGDGLQSRPRGGTHRVIHGRSGQPRGRRSPSSSSPPPLAAFVDLPGPLALPNPLSTGMHVVTTSGSSYL